jgi:hypothetical protein
MTPDIVTGIVGVLVLLSLLVAGMPIVPLFFRTLFIY